jgi:5-methylcytosine-specific restriction endonuclease McrA
MARRPAFSWESDMYPPHIANAPCFWCGAVIPGKMSWDHVVPLALHGRQIGTNLVRACRACNASRGQITSAHGLRKNIIMQLNGPAKRKAIGAFNLLVPAVRQLQDRWAAIEAERLGYSPSARAWLKPLK